LRNVGGEYRFFMLTGMLEAWALSYNLKNEVLSRPLTHKALSNAITALGGTLQDVVLDYFDEANKWYHAKLRIVNAHRLVAVDVRPSDAFNMAVVCKVPILILAEVLKRHQGSA